MIATFTEPARAEWECMHKCGDRFVVVIRDITNKERVADAALSFWAWQKQQEHSCFVETKK